MISPSNRYWENHSGNIPPGAIIFRGVPGARSPFLSRAVPAEPSPLVFDRAAISTDHGPILAERFCWQGEGGGSGGRSGKIKLPNANRSQMLP